MHLSIRERLADGTLPVIPEDPEIPIMILYGPNAIIKLRRNSPEITQIQQTHKDGVFKPYQGRMRVTEQLQTSEWATVGSLGNN
jgi:hypothetical protein